MSKDLSNVHLRLGQLIDGWCERRALKPLRAILPYYPLPNGFTEDWALLAKSLKTIRVQFANDLALGELDQVIELQHLVEAAVYG